MQETQDLPAVINVDREMSVQEISAQSLKIHHILEAVMQEDIHYGLIPGTPKKTLYQAGAEKICMTFRLAPRYDVEDLSDPTNNFYRYRAKCSLVTISEGRFVGSAMGEASTMEEKYQWEKAVNEKHWESTDPTRRRIHFKKDGTEVLQVQRNCADLANTVLKISCKRAFVSATKGATAASDLLDVDLDEEAVADLKKQEQVQAKPKAKPKPAPKFPYGKHKGVGIDDPSVTVEELNWWIGRLTTDLSEGKNKQYEKSNRAFLEALQAEKLKRDQVSSSAITDDAWKDACTLWQASHEAIYAEVCIAMGLDDAFNLEPSRRVEFHEKIRALMS